ncbi:MAG TPA: phosphoribosylformylglycinamidine synthase subunit PurL [Acidobacteriota bacterium]|nr:phosphoribosylformylglycinamidine synthase subunit PurL [Acidobacteriota bacterium]
MPISTEVIEGHGLTSEEYDRIVEMLGREPNLTELGIFSVMWSEHCSYKSSRVHLKTLPTEGPQVIEGPGENAGVVDIGDGLAAVFKIESHNHPSYIEPYQGAATGVGGIIRDIFTMGARPVACMNSLHFGPLDSPRNQYTMEGVVAGIAGYGNCMGIPTVGGEVYFQERYGPNPIVNAFCLGIAKADRIFRGTASGPGNPVIYVGAKTGRDGIHGATMASEEFSEDSEAKRPTVQVGDPLMEKLLLEACLEAMEAGLVIGIQDMGAAGLTCSTTEMASRAGQGVRVDLSKVPQREKDMTPYEIMLSESQERMLLVVEKGREQRALDIFKRWGLDAVVVGEVIETPELIVDNNGHRVAELPNRGLTDEAPLYRRPMERPAYLEALPDWREQDISEPRDCGDVLTKMMSSEHLCSRRWVYRQYDHVIRTNTVSMPGSDASVLRLKGTRGGLALSLDGNPRFCYLEPRMGARMAVAESCRNVVASGARPLAATNCLNFANPENPGIMWQFAEVVAGIGEACSVFSTPITGGNVSFYNETQGRGILPTPVIGMLGKIEDLSKRRESHFRRQGDIVYLLGATRAELGGSIYLETLGLPLAGPCPQLDLRAELHLLKRVLDWTQQELFESIHDLSEGGLGAALAESCFKNGLGIEAQAESSLRCDHFLFSETPSRLLVSLRPDKEQAFLDNLGDVPAVRLGTVGGSRLILRYNKSDCLDLSVEELREAWDSHFPTVFKH